MARILYFGRLGDVTGIDQEHIPLPVNVNDTAGLRQWIDTRFEADGTFLEKTVRIALNDQFATEPTSVSDADDIAFMPPVGGG